MSLENVILDLHLEQELTSALNQINPDPEFVNRLHRKITQVGQFRAATIRNGAVLAVLGIALFIGALIIWIAKTISGKSRE